jgi:hypothetical protein
LAPSLDLWWNIHRPSVAALVESLGISCRAEDAWEAADALIGTHPGGLVALDAMIGNTVDVSPQLRQNQVCASSADPRRGTVTRAACAGFSGVTNLGAATWSATCV